MFREDIIKLLKKDVSGEIELEVPSDCSMGDFAFPCFSLSKQFKKSPNVIALELKSKIKPEPFLVKVEVNGAYINFFVNKTLLGQKILKEIYEKRESYGSSDEGKGKTVVDEFSSPNIAKPFHIGHLRSTVLGNALYNIHAFFGYKVIRINHLGDWGTQFGKLIVAHLKWKDDVFFKKDPITYLLDIYVKFHAEAEKHPELEDEARQWFKKLEDGDKEALKLWAKFNHASIDEFRRVYKVLGIEFDSWNGEAFYNDKIESSISEVEKHSLAIMDDGALVVKLDRWAMPALMLRKSDGASTYHSRDLAAALYRLKNYSPVKLLYVVGSPQKLHFRQLFKLLDLMGLNNDKFVHVDFGQYSLDDGKISTREGRVIFMEDVLSKTIALAEKVILEKNPRLKNRGDVARMVGLGAVFFSDLVNDRTKDIVFDWDRMLDFEGDTAPYLQYTYARACSIIKKCAKEKNLAPGSIIEYGLLCSDVEKRLITLLSVFQERVRESLIACKPHIIAQYLLTVGRCFNEFYHACPILQADKNLGEARLLLVFASAQVVKNGLSLLGIGCPEEM